MDIYVDVLFAVNFFITYLLLMLTSALVKAKSETKRFLLSAFFGALYSFVIFIPEFNMLLDFILRLVASAVIVFTAFGYKRLFVFLKTLLCFYFSNMIFLGVIIAVWITFKPKGIVINNGAVYFNIPAKILLLLALFAYVLSLLLIKLYNYTVSKKEIYSLTIILKGEEYKMFAFLDSGNKLTEPFSGYPVIIVDKSKISFEAQRLIPYNTVGGEGVLEAFQPDKVIISNGKKSFDSDRVYVAASNVESKEFSAILSPEILNL